MVKENGLFRVISHDLFSLANRRLTSSPFFSEEQRFGKELFNLTEKS